MIYQKLDEDDLKLINKISKLTLTNYEVTGDFIPVDSLISVIEDLMVEYDGISEEFEDYKQYVDYNYRPLTIAEQIGEGVHDYYG